MPDFETDRAGIQRSGLLHSADSDEIRVILIANMGIYIPNALLLLIR